MDILRLIVIVAIAIINVVILIFLIKNDLSKKESLSPKLSKRQRKMKQDIG